MVRWEKGGLSLARFSDQLLMIGEPKTLQAAVDRRMRDSKNYSPLLARAAQFAGKTCGWSSSRLPDELASRFVPLEMDAKSFAGSLSVRNGLELEAVLAVGSEQQATASAEKLKQSIPTMPGIARGLEVSTEDGGCCSSCRQQGASSRGAAGPEPAAPAAPVETIKVETPKQVERVAVALPATFSKRKLKNLWKSLLKNRRKQSVRAGLEVIRIVLPKPDESDP